VTHENNGNGAANGHAPAPRLNLAPQHLDDLRRSGLTETTIVAARLQTVTDAGLIKRCLNWDYSAVKLGPCLAFPYPTPDGGKTGGSSASGPTIPA
jgi:hypothetical protein